MSAEAKPQIGMKYSATFVVEERHTVPQVSSDWPGFADMPPILATAIMIGFIEQTCIEGLRQCLAPTQHTVGTYVDVSHVAPTPIGLTVRADVELIAVDKRTLTFRIVCYDGQDMIGEGLHRRAIIDTIRFAERLQAKRN